jgi:hypothetical protein
MPRTVLIVEPCDAGDLPDRRRPLMLFELETLRAVTAELVHNLQQPRPSPPLLERLCNGLMDVVTLSFLRGLLSSLSRRGAAEEARRAQWNAYLRERAEMNPAAFLRWLDNQEMDRVVVDCTEWNLTWLFLRAIPGPAALRFSEKDDSEAFPFLEAYCRQCGMAYPLAQLEMEYFGYDHGPLAMGDGRRLVCQKKHVIVDVLDWES